MTWWYRWLCRLSGVLGAVCEYPARGRGRGGRLHRKLRMRAGSPPPAPPRPVRKVVLVGVRHCCHALGRGEAGAAESARFYGCHSYRPAAWAPGSGAAW